jgi:hypothetical protein
VDQPASFGAADAARRSTTALDDMNSRTARWFAVPVIAAAATLASFWPYQWVGLLAIQCVFGCSLAGDTSCQCSDATAAAAAAGLASGFVPVLLSALVAPSHKRLVGILTGVCLLALYFTSSVSDLRAVWLILLFEVVGITLALLCVTWLSKRGMSSNNALERERGR